VRSDRHPHELDADVAGAFRAAMSRLAAGVVMVTCHVGDRPWGLTVSACCSVSMDPPLLLVSLGRETTSARAIAETGSFGVALLGDHLLEVARFGAAQGRSKFVDEFCVEDGAGSRSPVVAGSLAHIDCEVRQAVDAGDHTLFIGDVALVAVHERDRPLVHCERGFHRLHDLTDPETVDSLLFDYPVPRTFARGLPLGR
jgi:flavin reductase (DIM6/NTAB) family NADH-FMN oxidoreductase RutF